jgi:beta-galactosidase
VLTRSGLELGSKKLPLYAGSVHYWRMPREVWKPSLEAVRSLGLGLVDTYVPWAAHEKDSGVLDFGATDPRLDLVAFLELAAELELFAIVRPGPHINAELTYFGIPERIIWDPECQARSAGGHPVVLPVPPLAFPVPSYASKRFLEEASRWLEAAAERIAPLCYPRGPVVLVQVDNEGAMYFRDGVYDQDYHPDAIRGYRRFLKRKYESSQELSRAHGHATTFSEIAPPRHLDAEKARDLTRHLDWAEAQEELLAKSFRRMKRKLVAAGISVPFSHNFPIGEVMTPLDPGRVSEVVELVGLDYYHAATPEQSAEMARRTSDLAVRSTARDVPAFACELGAGFPPFFPALTETDNLFTAMTALAYGLRGFNVYMAVERDRWIGAPYDRHARARPSAERWRRLTRALDAVSFHELQRETPVHLLVPRSLRRLHRVQHAFGPLSAVVFQVLGRGATDAGLEDEFDLGGPFALDTERFLRWFEDELERRRVPFAVVGGDLAEYSLEHAAWTIVACAGGLEREIARALGRGLRQGKAISIGPHFPQRDETLVPREPPSALRHAHGPGRLPSLLDLDPPRLSRVLDSAVELLRLPRLEASPSELRVTVHHDRASVARVLFAINPTGYPLAARVGSLGASSAVDVLDETAFDARFGVFDLSVPPRQVRMLALRS